MLYCWSKYSNLAPAKKDQTQYTGDAKGLS
jgi:hypothetical protein